MEERYKYKKVRREHEQPTFILSTNDVKEFLQLRLDFIVAKLRKMNETYAKLPNIQVDVFGSQASDVYVPLMVILPPAVLKDESENIEENIPTIYFDRDEDSQLHLIQEIKDFLGLFSFTKFDREMLTNREFLAEKRISTKVGQMISNFAEPRYRKQKNSDSDAGDMVLLFIDPIRVFHEMVQLEGESRKSYTISIIKIKKIRDTQYNYHIKKNYRGKRKKKKSSFYREMDQLLKRVN